MGVTITYHLLNGTEIPAVREGIMQVYGSAWGLALQPYQHR